jgi:hypothetical protein
MDKTQPNKSVPNLNPEQSLEFTCRICFDKGEASLIAPCHCNGTLRFVHEDCIKHWILASHHNYKNARCEICGCKYQSAPVGLHRLPLAESISRHFCYCCAIPILLILIFSLSIILGVSTSSKINFSTDFSFSLFIVIISAVPLIIMTGLLILSIVKICCAMECEDWKILPLNINSSRTSLLPSVIR